MTLKFLQTGCWNRSQVAVSWTPNTRRLLPQVETAIDLAWTTALARPGVHLFDGPMCRLESWSATDDRLSVSLSKSSYKPFLGTNMANPKFADDFGPDVMANPLGVSPALVTADGFILLGRRNASVAYHPNRVHPFAGCMEPSDADPFASIYRELKEELSLAPEEIIELHCTGLVEDQNLHQPELIFAAVSILTKSQIESRLDPVEHHSIWSIPATRYEIKKAIEQDSQLTPIAVAALALWMDRQDHK
jgi:8-oxo-dGTP pyrophosphatase MutT (NUDIX family)